MKPGQVVLYRLNARDVERINSAPPSKRNTAHVGERYPAMIVRTHTPACANLHVFHDGNRTLWVTSAQLDTTPAAPTGTFAPDVDDA